MILTILFLFLSMYSLSLDATETDSDDDSQLESVDSGFNELPPTSRLTHIQDSLDILMGLPGNPEINLHSSVNSSQRNLRLIDLESDDSSTSSEPTSSFPIPHCDFLTDSLDALLASPQTNQSSGEERVPRLAFSSLSTAWSDNIENDLTPRRYPYGRVTWIAVLSQLLSNSDLSPAATNMDRQISAETVDTQTENRDDDIFEPRPRFRHPRIIGHSDPLFSYPLSENPDAKKVRERRERKRKAREAALEFNLEEEKSESPRASPVPIDSKDLGIWLKTQLYLQNRALAFQEQQSKTLVNLKEELDLWSILIQRGIYKRDEHVKPLEWVKEQTLVNGSGLEGVIGQFDGQLQEYEIHINLFRTNYDVDERDFNFMMWFSNLPERRDHEMSDEKLLTWLKGMKKTLMKMPVGGRIAGDRSKETLKQSLHRKWLSALPWDIDTQPQSHINKAVAQAMYMEIQRYKFIQLQTRLEEFYKEQLAALPPITAENIADFSLRSIDLSDAHLVKFMEGRHEKNEGVVEVNPISAEEIEAMISFIQTHQEHTLNYINSFL